VCVRASQVRKLPQVQADKIAAVGCGDMEPAACSASSWPAHLFGNIVFVKDGGQDRAEGVLHCYVPKLMLRQSQITPEVQHEGCGAVMRPVLDEDWRIAAVQVLLWRRRSGRVCAAVARHAGPARCEPAPAHHAWCMHLHKVHDTWFGRSLSSPCTLVHAPFGYKH